MSNKYMNQVFQHTFQKNFENGYPELEGELSQYWVLDDEDNTGSHRNRKDRRGVFSEQDKKLLSLIGQRKGIKEEEEFDGTGKRVDKAQLKLDWKVKSLMMKVGLIPNEKEARDEAERMKVRELNMDSPFKGKK